VRSKEIVKPKAAFTKKDLVVVLGCFVFLLVNIGAIGTGGRRRAREAACLSNLRQWGAAFQMYTNDNDGSFMEGNLSGGTPRRTWIYILQPYYRDGKLKLCPMATKPWGGIGRMDGDTSSPFVAVGPIWGGTHYYKFEVDRNEWTPPDLGMDDPWPEDFPYTEEENYLSYAKNDYVRNDPRPGRRRAPFWRTSGVKGAGNVPLMVDAKQFYVVMPRGYKNSAPDPAPPYKGAPGGWANPMATICIDRHNAAINGVFLDWSARKIGLKELWKLKWNREYPTCNEWTKCGGVQPEDWPEWMRNFKDY